MKHSRLTLLIFIALILGVLFGHFAPHMAVKMRAFALIFLRMVKMIIAPLLFATLVTGIAGHGDTKKLGKIGVKTIIYFEIVTTLALIIGLTMGNLFNPGKGFVTGTVANPELLKEAGLMAVTTPHTSISEMIVNVFPTSIVRAMAEYVMYFAPLGIFGAIASTVGMNGLSILKNYAKIIFSLYTALAVFVLLVLFIACKYARISFRSLLKAIQEPAILAFSTASSEAAFPKAITIMERFGVPQNIVSFVMPTGYTFNLDGSTLYLAMAVIFSSQICGIDLNLNQQLLMMLALMLTSKGIAGVPRVSLVVLAGTLSSFNIPIIGVAILLGIDQVLDMGRTTVNLIGNCVATVVIARWENEFDYEKMRLFIKETDSERSELNFGGLKKICEKVTTKSEE